MKHLRRIRRTFVRQLSSHDCGIACICMILKYSAREGEAMWLRETSVHQDLSLLDLRSISAKLGLQARCVEMDFLFLRTNLKPCILHLSQANSEHFEVCFGKHRKSGDVYYLMGDPARGIYSISENNLKQVWKSRAALYFENIATEPIEAKRPSWHLLLSSRLIPKAMLFTIPLISIFMGLLGVAWSWALQRGIYDSIAEKETRLIRAIIILLFLVTLAKNGLAYIRQELMIRLNSLINEHLILNLIRQTIRNAKNTDNRADSMHFKNGMTAMLKMQQAVSAFLFTFLSEGSIIILALSGLFYQSFAFGFINLCYLLVTIYRTYRNLPSVLFDHAHLNELAGTTEKFILKVSQVTQNDPQSQDQEVLYNFHADNHLKYLSYAGKVSRDMSRNSLIVDCLGTINIICVFIYGIFKMQRMDLSYSAFMIAVVSSYFLTTLIPKVCTAMVVVFDGIESSRQYHVRF